MTKPKTLKINAKCADGFYASLEDTKGNAVGSDYDSYVPKFMPGQHYGDYVELEIDLATGRILNWTPPTTEQLEEAFGDLEALS